MLPLPSAPLQFLRGKHAMHIIVVYFERLPAVQCVHSNVGLCRVSALTGASHTAAVMGNPKIKKHNQKKFLLFVNSAAVPEAPAQSGVSAAAVPSHRW